MILKRVAVYPPNMGGVGGIGALWCPLGGVASSSLMLSRERAYVEVGDKWLGCRRQRLVVALGLLMTGGQLLLLVGERGISGLP